MRRKPSKRPNGTAQKRDIPCATAEDPDGMALTYGRVTKMLGNGRVDVNCVGSITRQCRIRGTMRRREWVKVHDIVLVSFREFDQEKADIIFRYTDAEVQILRNWGEPLNELVDVPHDSDGENDVVFRDGDDEDHGVLFQSSSPADEGQGADIDIDAV